MADYLMHARTLCNQLVAIGEIIPESELVLAVIGGLGTGYESLVTSMTFLDLEVILKDYDMSNAKEKSAPNFAHTVATVSQQRPTSENQFVCQIFGKKNHIALNCYNRYNAIKFPHNHKRNVGCSGVPIGGGSMNLAFGGGNDQLAPWYLDSGASSHVTSNSHHLI